MRLETELQKFESPECENPETAGGGKTAQVSIAEKEIQTKTKPSVEVVDTPKSPA